jgi:carbon-monoxide dehydrogenase large subunit
VKPAAFRYHRADSLEAAVALLAEHGSGARVLAGGQSLVPQMSQREIAPSQVVDIMRVEDLRGITHVDGVVEIRAAVRQSEVEDDATVRADVPLLAEALGKVAYREIRNAGTVCGSLAHGDPLGELPAVAVALDAQIIAIGPSGARSIPAAAFFEAAHATALEPDEVLAAVRFPVAEPGTGSAFLELAPRKGGYALAGVAAVVRLQGGVITAAALGCWASPGHRCASGGAERLLVGQSPSAELYRAAAEATADDIDPRDDVHASAVHRSRLAAVLARRASGDRHRPERGGPMTRIDVTVNGVRHEAEVEDRKLLVDVIRDDFALTGTKIGCAHGVCGSCTVHVDGVAVRSCLTFAVQVDGCSLRTVEDLAGEDGALHPLQEEFQRAHGLQCGFCTPGLLMTAVGAVEAGTPIDEAAARQLVAGNLCRCTGYDGIGLRGGRRRPEDGRGRHVGGTAPVTATDADFVRQRWVGQAVLRVEDPKMLVGAARYVGDLAPAGAVEAAFVRSPHPHARIQSVDVSAARALPGVLAVYTAADLAGTVPLAHLVSIPEVLPTPRGALASDKVRFVGEPVAVVIATDRYVAEDAVELVAVGYEPLPAVASVAAARRADAPLLHDHVPGNCYYHATGDTGGTQEAFARAAHVVRRKLHQGRAVSSAIEARGIVAALDPSTEELTCWISSQAPHQQRYFLATALGLPENRIRVVAPSVGGAFGPKDFIFPEDVCVAWAAMRLRRPVRWIEDRRENLTAAPQAKQTELELELAADADGRLLAARGRFTGDTGAYSYSAPGGLIDFALTAQGIPGPYRIGAYAFEIAGVLTNKAPIAPYRGVGFTAAQTIRELLLDDLARELDLDPAELRRRNLLDERPQTSVTGMTYDGGSYVASLDRALELVGYEGFRARQQAARADGRLLGIGISPFIEMTSMGTRSALQSGVNIFSHDNARVSIDLTGKITVAVGTCSHGQGHHTAFAQVAADAFGVDPGDVVVVDGDTGRTPWGMGTFASRSAVFGTGTILRAARPVRDKLLRVASLLLEAPVRRWSAPTASSASAACPRPASRSRDWPVQLTSTRGPRGARDPDADRGGVLRRRPDLLQRRGGRRRGGRRGDRRGHRRADRRGRGLRPDAQPGPGRGAGARRCGSGSGALR